MILSFGGEVSHCYSFCVLHRGVVILLLIVGSYAFLLSQDFRMIQMKPTKPVYSVKHTNLVTIPWA